jgi:hypothetical protein
MITAALLSRLQPLADSNPDLKTVLAFVAQAAIIAKQAKIWSPGNANPLYDLFDPSMMDFELP